MKRKLILSFLFIVLLGISSCSQKEDAMSASDNLLKSRSVGFVLDYPPADAMANHYIVIHAMDMAWQQMKSRVANGNGRSEFGFYIRYLFEQNTFATGSITEGPVVTECAGTNASINLGIPNDNLTVCGFFHCHTSIQNCPAGDWRYTGPSESDINWARNHNLPGILYDYSTPIIRAGQHHANDAYKVYTFGPTVRPELIINN